MSALFGILPAIFDTSLVIKLTSLVEENGIHSEQANFAQFSFLPPLSIGVNFLKERNRSPRSNLKN